MRVCRIDNIRKSVRIKALSVIFTSLILNGNCGQVGEIYIISELCHDFVNGSVIDFRRFVDKVASIGVRSFRAEPEFFFSVNDCYFSISLKFGTCSFRICI